MDTDSTVDFGGLRKSPPLHFRAGLGAVNVPLSPDDLRHIESAYSKITVHGARTAPVLIRMSDDMT